MRIQTTRLMTIGVRVSIKDLEFMLFPYYEDVIPEFTGSIRLTANEL